METEANVDAKLEADVDVKVEADAVIEAVERSFNREHNHTISRECRPL